MIVFFICIYCSFYPTNPSATLLLIIIVKIEHYNVALAYYERFNAFLNSW